MRDFGTYSPREVIESNLSELDTRFFINCEQELAHLRELAGIVTEHHAAREEDFLSSLPDHSSRRSEPLSDTPESLTQAVLGAASLRTVRRSVFLASEIRNNIAGDASSIPMSFFFRDENELQPSAIGRVSYQRSGYTDAAFLRFSASIPSLRASYAPRFSSGCEDVYNGVSEYCILPIETSKEGALNSFYSLLDHYGLKIKATCSIRTPDASHLTRYALIGRTHAPLSLGKRYKRYFELALPITSTPTVGEVLLSAQLSGLRLAHLSTLPSSEEGAAPKARFSFCTDDGALDVFLLYLAMDAPHYEMIGIFSQIE